MTRKAYFGSDAANVLRSLRLTGGLSSRESAGWYITELTAADGTRWRLTQYADTGEIYSLRR